MDRNDFIEKGIGGVLGAIAIIAAVIEMVLGGFSAESIVAAVKDVAGTAVVIVVLIAFANEHKKAKGIRSSIESAMLQLEKGYFHMIREAVAAETSGEAKKAKLERTVRYEIAVNTDALFGAQCKNYAPFFDVSLEAPTEVCFYIRKKFFGEKPDAPFDAKRIFDKISQYMKRQHESISMEFKQDASGGKVLVAFDNPLKYTKENEWFIQVVDDMIFVYTMIQS